MATQYGQWKVSRSLDEGGQAHVFLVADTTGQYAGHYVLKRLKNPGRLDLFEREVKALEALTHQHVLRIVARDVTGPTPYYVAEYCEGGSLAKDPYRFDHHIGSAATELSLIAEALQAAHAVQVIHRDVKPGNILFRKDGTPVLGDFGICHMEGDQRITLADEAMGSRNYIAPEMESGGRRLGPPSDRTDVYSLGKVLYWTVTGGGEFARENHRAPGLYLPDVFFDQQWEHVHALLDEMVVEDPKQRLPMAQVITRLHEVADLMTGRYTPLRGSMRLRCRFCGKGVYERYAGKGQPSPSHARAWFSEIQRNPSTDLRVLRCKHCGHVEWFDFDHVLDPKWWDR